MDFKKIFIYVKSPLLPAFAESYARHGQNFYIKYKIALKYEETRADTAQTHCPTS